MGIWIYFSDFGFDLDKRIYRLYSIYQGTLYQEMIIDPPGLPHKNPQDRSSAANRAEVPIAGHIIMQHDGRIFFYGSFTLETKQDTMVLDGWINQDPPAHDSPFYRAKAKLPCVNLS